MALETVEDPESLRSQVAEQLRREAAHYGVLLTKPESSWAAAGRVLEVVWQHVKKAAKGRETA